jgi:hypothetical protein
MKYTKPQITLIASASDAIQSDLEKLIQHVPDRFGVGSTPAYEADE